MDKREIKLLTQIGIGLGAVLGTLAITGDLPFWVLPIGIVIYLIGLIFN